MAHKVWCPLLFFIFTLWQYSFFKKSQGNNLKGLSHDILRALPWLIVDYNKVYNILLWPDHTCFLILNFGFKVVSSLFSIVPSSCYDGPQKIQCNKIVAVRAKTRWQVLSVRTMVVRPLAYRSCLIAICQWIWRRVVAKSAGSGGQVFYIDECATVRTVALKRPFFKRKKGFATISLGLIYHSMVSSQPPSRDTVPLIQLCWSEIKVFISFMLKSE
jgi:hypothetical protein